MINVSSYIAEELFNLGVFHVFGYQGSNITYLVDAISTHSGLRYVQAYHEQGAAFAANGYAQASGGLGVAIASSGPGALNLVTGIANAYYDSIPVLFICGDLSHRYKKNLFPLRQDGFQSTDIVSIVRPITKYATLISRPDDIRYCFERALFEATNGRRGPVLLSIPHWIQGAEINTSALNGYTHEHPEIGLDADPLLEDIRNGLLHSRRPLMLLGGGCVNANTKTALNHFLGTIHLPVIASLCGLGVISHDHPSFIGFIGDYGHRHANLALAASDYLIVLGSRLDERQIGFLKEYRENKTIVHVDIDQSELLCPSARYIPVCSPIADFLNSLDFISFEPPWLSEWKNNLQKMGNKYPVHISTEEMSPSSFLLKLFSLLTTNTQVFVDVGLHQMCVAQYGVLVDGKQLYFSGGLGSMGYALPASIGGCLANPDKSTICVVGDGGLMMSLPELQIIARDRHNVKIVVFNNHCLGMVRNHQRKVLGGRSFGSVDGYLAGDMKKIAQAFDLEFFRISKQHELDVLANILGTIDPLLLEVVFPNDMMPSPASVDYPIKEDVLLLQQFANDF